jgi:CRISPR-associated protein Csm5
MNYRVTCLSPTLVGDGQKLSPIDYMVWKEHVNVLDQGRIFKILSKGPRLEGYLTQLKKAERLDFAAWGGFAQNFAGRRIPFDHPSAVPIWEGARPENLFIPTFATSTSGPYLPATAVKGALRTGAVHDRWSEATMRHVAARLDEGRFPRDLAVKAEDSVLGGPNGNRMRRFSIADSGSHDFSGMKVYLVRVSTLIAKGKDASGADRFELGWKSARGSAEARRVDDSTPFFVEMAAPGTSFQGRWSEKAEGEREALFAAANKYAAEQIALHKKYAAVAGLAQLAAFLDALDGRLTEVRKKSNGCLLSIGWGGGMLGKLGYVDTTNETYRGILRQTPFYNRAIQSGLPLPKTRRVIFQGGRPASLPGWVQMEVG